MTASPIITPTTPLLHNWTWPENATTRPASKLYDPVWTVGDCKIMGGVLWLAVIIILIGNASCFYAVWKNIKKILEHPFFQSNMLCIYLSFVDILLVVLVGIPAAVAFSSPQSAVGLGLANGNYNMDAVGVIMDYLVWLQLILITGICVDRAGHIARPMRYTYSLNNKTTIIACVLCTVIPFVLLVLPSLINELVNPPFDPALRGRCTTLFTDPEDGPKTVLGDMFLGCLHHMSSVEDGSFLMIWEQTGEALIITVSVFALVASNVLITVKLIQSAKLQRQRQDALARIIRINTIVALGQVLMVLISTVPYRHFMFHKRFQVLLNLGDMSRMNEFYAISVRVLVFFGPIFNPWLYPIRMASIRTFLQMKRRTFVTSMSSSLMKLRGMTATVNQPLRNIDDKSVRTTDLDPTTVPLVKASPRTSQCHPV